MPLDSSATVPSPAKAQPDPAGPPQAYDGTVPFPSDGPAPARGGAERWPTSDRLAARRV